MAPINNRNTNHLNSPYARTPRKTYGARSQNQPPSTPGSLFKRVTQIFTPAAWLNGSASSSSFKKRPSFTENELNSVVGEAERSIIVHDAKESLLADSPNVKLANFFANKGTQPLTDIEIEGVKSLLAQSQSSVSTPNKRKFSMSALDGPEEPSTPTVLKNESGKTILRQTPKFNASYSSNNTAETSTSNSLVKAPAKSVTPFKRKVFDYSAFPSPYRSSRLKNSILYLENDKNDNKKAKVEEPVVEEKKLSSTASALLSFLDNTESTSTTALPTTTTTTTSAPSSSSSSSALSSKDTSNSIDYSNPYASKTKRSRKALVHRKPSKFEQLEKSFASASKAEQTDSPTTATATPNKQLTTTQTENDAAGTTPISTEGPTVDTHKPIISSALRKSITFESSDDVPHKQATSTTPSAKPFQFDVQAKNSSNADELEQKDETPSKPSLFSLGATNKEDNTKLSVTTSSGFNFGGVKASNEEKKTNALDTTTTVAPTTTTKTEEASSSKPLQPATIPTSSIALPVPGSKEFIFTFPDVSESSKYSKTDVDQSKLEQFKDLFAF